MPGLARDRRTEQNTLTMPTNIESEPTLRYSEKLRQIARRVCWWQTPDEALAYMPGFLAQVMTYGTWNDVQHVRTELGDDALRNLLKSAPPGIFDARSWHYWHRFFGMTPIPPLPRRQIP